MVDNNTGIAGILRAVGSGPLAGAMTVGSASAGSASAGSASAGQLVDNAPASAAASATVSAPRERRPPKPSAPLCDLFGCGMPATANTNDINHCEHHSAFPLSEDGKLFLAKRVK